MPGVMKERAIGLAPALSALSFAGPVGAILWYTVGMYVVPGTPTDAGYQLLVSAWVAGLILSIPLGLTSAHFGSAVWRILAYVAVGFSLLLITVQGLMALSFYYGDEFPWSGVVPFPVVAWGLIAAFWASVLAWLFRRHLIAIGCAWFGAIWMGVNVLTVL
jgi:hypothetical protein